MKKIKITTIILAIILVTLVTFGGVYIKTQNRMENKVKEYTLGRELEGSRKVELKVKTSDESKTNTENLTEENYQIVKNTIEKRLNNLGAEDYTISLNKEDGTIKVELAENETTDTYAYFLTANGKVQIKEKDATTELLSDSMVEKSIYTYTADSEAKYQVYLELQLTEEGQAKIEEIKNNYAILVNEVEEIEAAEEAKKEKAEGENKTEGETTTETSTEKAEPTKKIAVLTIAGSEYDIEKIEKNKVTVRVGTKTNNSSSINNNIALAAEMTMLINSGKYPVEYEINDNKFIYTDITEEQMLYLGVAVAIVILAMCVIFTIKYKAKGVLVSVSCIGYISILLLILRYTNVNISIEGIGAIILVLAFNYRMNQIILNKTKTVNMVNEAVITTYKEIFLKLVPVMIITLVFCFAKWTNLTSFGLIMFWGLLLMAVYNIIVTKTLLKLKESK